MTPDRPADRWEALLAEHIDDDEERRLAENNQRRVDRARGEIGEHRCLIRRNTEAR